jgi:LysR family transcriptional regulator, regulator for bpeEF and oprC
VDRDVFRGIVPFVVVAEERSFRGAAAKLGVSPAAVSKAVQQLEQRVGVALLVRNARSAALTPEGVAFFARCQEAMRSVAGARETLDAARSLPAGELTVSVPFVASPLLAPALALLRARYAQLHFRVVVTDRLSKLAEESVDIAVRVGPVREASLVARRLRRTRLVTVAAPSYLARRGTPRKVDELSDHDRLVLLSPHGKPHPWLFREGQQPVRGAVVVDHGPTLADLALAGLGVTQLFDYMAIDHVRAGTLSLVLERDIAAGPDVHALCAPGRRAAARIRVAFEAFADAFAASPSRE